MGGPVHRRGTRLGRLVRADRVPQGPVNTDLPKPGCAGAAGWPRASLACDAASSRRTAAKSGNANALLYLFGLPVLRASGEPEIGSGEHKAVLRRESGQRSEAADF